MRAGSGCLLQASAFSTPGTRATWVYVIAEGALQIYAHAADGSALMLAAMRAGELVGDYFLLDDAGPRQSSASARALEATRLLGLEPTAIVSVLERDPALAAELRARRARTSLARRQKPSEIFELLHSLGGIDLQQIDAFKPDQVIFRGGDEADAAWLITAGEVRVYAEADPDATIARHLHSARRKRSLIHTSFPAIRSRFARCALLSARLVSLLSFALTACFAYVIASSISLRR